MSDVESELAALRRPAPFEVDVAARVMARIATLPAPRPALPRRVVRVTSIAAGLAGIASLAGLAASWPAARHAIGAAILDALALARAVGGPSTTVASAARGVARVVEFAGSTAATLAAALEPMRPLAAGVTFALAAATLAAMTVVVLRDLIHAPVVEER